MLCYPELLRTGTSECIPYLHRGDMIRYNLPGAPIGLAGRRLRDYNLRVKVRVGVVVTLNYIVLYM